MSLEDSDDDTVGNIDKLLKLVLDRMDGKIYNLIANIKSLKDLHINELTLTRTSLPYDLLPNLDNIKTLCIQRFRDEDDSESLTLLMQRFLDKVVN